MNVRRNNLLAPRTAAAVRSAGGLACLLAAVIAPIMSVAAAIDGAAPPQHQSADAAAPQPWPLERALASIRVKPGLVVEAVATEPLVADPVAIDFGPDGRLWVAEMPDYWRLTDEEFEQHGSIRALVDEDGDGVFDTSSEFVSGLRFPTGVKAWRNGVLVCDAPDVIYYEDADGDGKAEIRQPILTGFETINAQARVNSLRWGLDNWLHGACGLYGGAIRTVTGREVALGQRDFRFRPVTGELEPMSGRTQQGRSRNDAGDWFGCENESLLDHYPMSDRYLSRNPQVIPPPPEKMLPQPEAVTLHPIGQPTLLKLSGPPGRPTSACGLDFYRDELLGREYAGSAFVAEPVNQLVHRLVLTPQGSSFTATVAPDEQEAEFLASTDPWFRPVQVTTGPDGCLYIVDMHRAVIEDAKYIPAEVLAGLDLTAGQAEGRIYRVRPQGAALRPVRDLTKLGATELVAALDSPNGTVRDQVHQLLVERADAAAVAPLRALAADASRPAVRLQALCALDGLAGLTADILTAALQDGDASVRRHAVRLSEAWLATTPAVADAALKLVDDDDPQVRLQLACSLGEWRDPRTAPGLAALALGAADDPYILAGVWSSLHADNVEAVFAAIVADRSRSPVSPKVLAPAAKLALALGGRDAVAMVSRAVVADAAGEPAAWQFAVAADLMRAMRRHAPADAAVEKEVAPLIASARALVETATEEPGNDPPRLLAAMQLTAAVTADGEVLALAEPFFASTHAPEVQRRAVELAAASSQEEVVDAFIVAWPGLSAGARQSAFDAIYARSAHTARLLDQLADGSLPTGTLDASHRQRLLSHPDANIRARAAEILAVGVNADRDKLVREYFTAVDGQGDPALGKQVFAKNCSSCHVLEGVGNSVGPDLTALSSRTPQALVESILDPNRAVDDRFRSYTAMTGDGLAISGMLAAETATSVTIIDQQAQKHVLLRNNLDLLAMSAVSMMPEGLERELSPADLNHLIAYLTRINGIVVAVEPSEPATPPTTTEVPVETTAAGASAFKLGRILPAEPQASRRRPTVNPAVRVELVAAEPQVASPVAMADLLALWKQSATMPGGRP